MTLIDYLFSALKVKLMVRRSVNQLVEQGIMPRKSNYNY